MSKVRERINIVFQCTYMESRKMVLKNIFTGQQWRKRYKEQTYRYGERGGEGEMYGKSNMETYITTCKIDNQWEFALWLRKLKQGLCNNLAGWDGEEDGREIQKGGVYAYLWLILVEVWQKTTKLCKARKRKSNLNKQTKSINTAFPNSTIMILITYSALPVLSADTMSMYLFTYFTINQL